MMNSVADCNTHLDHVSDSVSEMSEVMRIIEKYKLPSRKEQEALDELAFEEEHGRRVAEALRGAPSKPQASSDA